MNNQQLQAIQQQQQQQQIPQQQFIYAQQNLHLQQQMNIMQQKNQLVPPQQQQLLHNSLTPPPSALGSNQIKIEISGSPQLQSQSLPNNQNLLINNHGDQSASPNVRNIKQEVNFDHSRSPMNIKNENVSSPMNVDAEHLSSTGSNTDVKPVVKVEPSSTPCSIGQKSSQQISSNTSSVVLVKQEASPSPSSSTPAPDERSKTHKGIVLCQYYFIIKKISNFSTQKDYFT